MKRWSKLQKQLYLVVDDGIDFQIHCSVYRMDSQHGGADLPRYWITLGKEIVFDYPKVSTDKQDYPYVNEITDISDLFRQYLDTPREQLPSKVFESDKYGVTNLLKCADKRISVTRLKEHFSNNEVVNADVCYMVLDARK